MKDRDWVLTTLVDEDQFKAISVDLVSVPNRLDGPMEKLDSTETRSHAWLLTLSVIQAYAEPIARTGVASWSSVVFSSNGMDLPGVRFSPDGLFPIALFLAFKSTPTQAVSL